MAKNIYIFGCKKSVRLLPNAFYAIAEVEDYASACASAASSAGASVAAASAAAAASASALAAAISAFFLATASALASFFLASSSRRFFWSALFAFAKLAFAASILASF